MLAGCLAVPLTVGGGLAVTAVLRSPLESDTRPEPVVATVGLAERLDSRATSITFVPADTFPVRSQTSGTVTGVSIVPGSPLTEGSVVMAVDGLDVRAYVAAAPLYRDLATGMSGDDVVTAQRFLVARGLLATADGTVGAATVRAIRAFNAGDGRSDTDTLSTGSLLWVPEGSEPPHAVTVRVGDAIDPQAELYTTSATSDAVVVATQPADVPRVVSLGGATVPLPAGATQVTAPADVAALHAEMADESTAAATVSATAPRTVGTVPASAVAVDQAGAACFFPDVTGPPVRISAEAGSFGLVDVDAALVGTPVLTDPRRTRTDLTCG